MKVLVVDDQASNRQLLSWILEDNGHECIEAVNGQIAIELFEKEEPDLVLLDVMMPVMDGYEAARIMKTLSGDKYIPIIFLTAMSDEKALIKCLESGGDDFLSKPFDEIVLQAKIKAHVRTKELNAQIRQKNEELEYLHNRLQQEHVMGEHVLSNAMKDSLTNLEKLPNIKHFISPMSQFNGDLLLVAAKPSGGFYVFLGDFTGHGLAASIGAVPVSQTFFTMAKKSLPLTEIARTINSSLLRFLPDHMFCAASIVEMSRSGNIAKIWTGGLPDAYVYREGKGLIGTIMSQNMPLGILDDDEFSDEFDVINLEAGDKICLYTDGIIEGCNSLGEMYGESRLKDQFDSDKPSLFDRVLDDFHLFKAGLEQDDDISLVEICSMAFDYEVETPIEDEIDRLPWSIDVSIETEELKNHKDPIASIVGLLPSSPHFLKHRDMIRMILAELYSNSLEHGILGIESRLKNTDEGFVQYYEERSARLMDLEDACIQVNLCFDPSVAKDTLLIQVKDSGKGFDIGRVNSDVDKDDCFGRGISLVRSLASSVQYADGGKSVLVHYSLKELDSVGKVADWVI